MQPANSEFAIFANGITDTKILYSLIDKLERLTAELYHNTEGTITSKVKNIGPSLTAIFNYLEQKGLEPQGDSAQKAYIEQVITYLKKLPIVKVTMAFEPDDTFSNRLNEVITGLVGHKIILDITVNHHIIAGLILEYQGKLGNYSFEPAANDFLKTRLHTFIEDSKEEIKTTAT